MDLRKRMKSEGYTITGTGGGFSAWCKELGSSHILIAYDDGTWDGVPSEPNWVVGRNDDECGYVCITDITLDQALDAARRLPIPPPGQQHEFYDEETLWKHWKWMLQREPSGLEELDG